MPCRTCRRIRSAVNTAAKALRLGQHQPKVKPSGKVYDRKRERIGREMTDAEKAHCEAVTRQVHADVASVLKDKPPMYNFAARRQAGDAPCP